MLNIADYFENVRLPTMPEVARLLISSMQDDEIPFEKIRSAISKDPALTAKLVRLANSSRFGLARKVGSVDDAITMVGLNQVRTLCLAACMGDAFPMAVCINREEFWKESMACAGFSHWLARTIGADAQQAWLTGFMLRLGELIIAQKEPEKLEKIERLPHAPGGRWERETDQTGFTEGHIVAELVRRWNFPPEVVRGLEVSSDPLAAKPFSRLGAVAGLGAAVNAACGDVLGPCGQVLNDGAGLCTQLAHATFGGIKQLVGLVVRCFHSLFRALQHVIRQVAKLCGGDVFHVFFTHGSLLF